MPVSCFAISKDLQLYVENKVDLPQEVFGMKSSTFHIENCSFAFVVLMTYFHVLS